MTAEFLVEEQRSRVKAEIQQAVQRALDVADVPALVADNVPERPDSGDAASRIGADGLFAGDARCLRNSGGTASRIWG
jgi:hypothetical protein